MAKRNANPPEGRTTVLNQRSPRRPAIKKTKTSSSRAEGDCAGRFTSIPSHEALKIARLGVALVEQLAAQPADDIQAYFVRQSAARYAWILERLVNPNRYPIHDPRRGRFGKPPTVVRAIAILCDRLKTLYEFLGWQDVCKAVHDPDVPREYRPEPEPKPWWASEGLRPPDIRPGLIHGLLVAVRRIATAAKFAYPDESQVEQVVEGLQRQMKLLKKHLSRRGRGSKSADHRKNGPKPPNLFWWNGRRAEFQPIPYRLLAYIWNQKDYKATVDDAIEVVWNGRPVEYSTLKSNVSRLNTQLARHNLPVTAALKNGYITLTISPS